MAARPLIRSIVVGWLLVLAALPTAAEGRAAALEELVVNDEVEGDVVALGGDVSLGPEAVVHGHVVAVFGAVRADARARVDGRVLEIGSLSGLRLEDGGRPGSAGLEWAIRLLAAGCWLLATTLAALVMTGRIRFGVRMIPALGSKLLVLGAMVLLTLFAAFVAVLGFGPAFGLPLAVVLAVTLLVAKTVGLAVLGGGLGGWLLGRATSRRMPLTVDVFCGVLVLVATRFVPILGGIAWVAVTVAALGAAVFTVVLGRQHGEVRAARTSDLS